MNKYAIITLPLYLSLAACGQQKEQVKEQPGINQQSKKEEMADLSKISNPEVKDAIEALQNGDNSWYAYFTENPVMTDDGNTIDFKNFFSKALGTEKFLTIDKVENDGKDVYGNFKTGRWGTFKVFFKFYQNSDRKFDRLDIGQAND